MKNLYNKETIKKLNKLEKEMKRSIKYEDKEREIYINEAMNRLHHFGE